MNWIYALIAAPFVIGVLANAILASLWAKDDREREEAEKLTKRKSRSGHEDAVDDAVAEGVPAFSAEASSFASQRPAANANAKDKPGLLTDQEELGDDELGGAQPGYAVPAGFELAEFSGRREQD